MADRAPIVIDASAVVEVVCGGPVHDAIREQVVGVDVVAPAILDLEVLSALRRLERAGDLDLDRAGQAVDDLARFRARRVALADLAGPAWSLRHNLRIGDAFYVALARAIGARLLTLDARLAAAPGLGVTVIIPAS